MDKLILTNAECLALADNLAETFLKQAIPRKHYKVWGVPRGGISVAYLILAQGKFILARCPEEADLIVDDVIDSGATANRHLKYNGLFYALIDKRQQHYAGRWVVFPWEQGETADTSADDIVTRLLQYVGEDPKRQGLVETPQRVLKAWQEWTAGYKQDPATIFKSFEDGAQNYDEMIVVNDLPFYSHCEHHLAPFFGTATIAYIPNKKIVGLSKFGRVLDIYAKRLQVQERLNVQVADAIQNYLKPLGVGVLLKARHLCMESRGLSKQGHITITSVLRGALFEDNRARNEFMNLAKL